MSVKFDRLLPWIVVFSASTFFFFEFMQVNMFNALDPYLFKAYHLTDTIQLGHLSANYMYANVLFLFPVGVLLDRFSTRRLISWAMFVCVTCTLVFSFTTQLWQGEICRFITGIGGAFCLLSCVRLASRWFPAKQMALVVGLIVTFAMLGAMIAQTPFTILVEDFGWRKTLLVDALLGYLMLILVFAFVKDYPAGQEKIIKAQQRTLYAEGVFHSVINALKNSQNWLAGVYAALINLPVFLLGNWGEMYLGQIRQLTPRKASVITSMMFVGLAIGSVLFGWLSDRFSRRRLPMILGAIVCLLVVLPIMYWEAADYFSLIMMFFLLGIAMGSQIISYAVIAESNRESLVGASEGVASVLIMSGGFLIPTFSYILDLNWQLHFQNGIPSYSVQAYHWAFSIMPFGFVLSLIAVLAMQETYCRSYSERKTHATT